MRHMDLWRKKGPHFLSCTDSELWQLQFSFRSTGFWVNACGNILFQSTSWDIIFKGIYENHALPININGELCGWTQLWAFWLEVYILEGCTWFLCSKQMVFFIDCRRACCGSAVTMLNASLCHILHRYFHYQRGTSSLLNIIFHRLSSWIIHYSHLL